jgi:cation diffusion facilitator CzcD-associated flavoprotein CzcO
MSITNIGYTLLLPPLKGHMFHTSRWDYEYTGGDSSGGLEGLRGKRVGIIGTGATAVQVVPAVAEYAGELTVFQVKMVCIIWFILYGLLVEYTQSN